jgi:hypothetical protein
MKNKKQPSTSNTMLGGILTGLATGLGQSLGQSLQGKLLPPKTGGTVTGTVKQHTYEQLRASVFAGGGEWSYVQDHGTRVITAIHVLPGPNWRKPGAPDRDLAKIYDADFEIYIQNYKERTCNILFEMDQYTQAIQIDELFALSHIPNITKKLTNDLAKARSTSARSTTRKALDEMMDLASRVHGLKGSDYDKFALSSHDQMRITNSCTEPLELVIETMLTVELA